MGMEKLIDCGNILKSSRRRYGNAKALGDNIWKRGATGTSF